MQDKRNLTRARKLRNQSTPFEIILWNHLKHGNLGGHKFRRQHVIDHAIVDFFCPAKGLIVEVDGDTHDAARDAVRDRRHAELGFATMRFTNADVGKNMTGVLEALLDRLNLLPDRWSIPSPSGEGKRRASAEGVGESATHSLPHPVSAAPSHPSPEGEGI